MAFIRPLLILAVLLSTILAKGVSAASWLPDKFKVTYESVNKDAITNKELRHKGELYYKYPNRVKLEEIKEKGKSIIVINPYQIYQFKEASLKGVPNELTIQKNTGGSMNAVSVFFDTLRKNGLNDNKLYTSKKNGKNVVITFTKKGVDKVEVKRAKMIFSGKKRRFRDLRELHITQESGKVFNLQKMKITSKLKLANEDFNFKTPDNTNVNQE